MAKTQGRLGVEGEPQLTVNRETGPQSYNHKRMNSHNLNEFEKEPRISDVHIGFQSCGPMSKKLS